MKAVAFLVSVAITQALPSPVQTRANYCIGTFSSFSYNVEGGDVLGQELRIVPVRDGFEGVLQLSEGQPSSLRVVAVVCQANRVTFAFAMPDDAIAGRFEGTASRDALVGTFHFDSGGVERVRLPRRHSYWDGK